tara:strand:+ start:9962 stop:10174 length:213 start_codon:yes stop_codon:yes gene_type:complete
MLFRGPLAIPDRSVRMNPVILANNVSLLKSHQLPVGDVNIFAAIAPATLFVVAGRRCLQAVIAACVALVV